MLMHGRLMKINDGIWVTERAPKWRSTCFRNALILRVHHSGRTLSISSPLPCLVVQVSRRGMLLRETFYACDTGHKCPPLHQYPVRHLRPPPNIPAPQYPVRHMAQSSNSHRSFRRRLTWLLGSFPICLFTIFEALSNSLFLMQTITAYRRKQIPVSQLTSNWPYSKLVLENIIITYNNQARHTSNSLLTTYREKQLLH